LRIARPPNVPYGFEYKNDYIKFLQLYLFLTWAQDGGHWSPSCYTGKNSRCLVNSMLDGP